MILITIINRAIKIINNTKMIMDKKKKKKIFKINNREDNISNFKILKIEKDLRIIMKIFKLKMKKIMSSLTIEFLINSISHKIIIKDKIKRERHLDKDPVMLKSTILMTRIKNQVFWRWIKWVTVWFNRLMMMKIWFPSKIWIKSQIAMTLISIMNFNLDLENLL